MDGTKCPAKVGQTDGLLAGCLILVDKGIDSISNPAI